MDKNNNKSKMYKKYTFNQYHLVAPNSIQHNY